MSVSTTPVSALQRAQSLQAEYSAGVERIQNDPHLSEEGKRAKLAELYRSYSQRIAPLEQEHATGQESRMAVLRRKAFGPPSADPARMAGFRQAMDRATTAYGQGEEYQDKRQALADLLEQAEMTGDEDQATACFVVGAQNGAEEVVTAFLADRPERAQAYVDYLNAKDAPTDLDGLFTVAAAFRVDEPTVGGFPVTREVL